MSWLKRWQYPAYTYVDVVVPAPPLSWYQPASEPVRFPPPVLEGGNYYVDVAVPAPPLSWYQPVSEPVRLPPPVLEGGSYYVDITVPTPPITQYWYQPTSEPVRLPPPYPEGGAVLVEFTTAYDPTQDFWHPRYELPIFPTPPYPEGGTTLVWKPTPAIIPDMCTWFMPTEQPYLIRQPNVAVGQQVLTEFSVPIPPEPGGVDPVYLLAL